VARPKPKLEIAFGAAANVDPDTVSDGWVDVSTYLRDFSGGAGGRQRDLDQVEAGTMTFVLDNRDRRFDPTHATGPYFPDVQPMAHVRLTEEASGEPIFRGFIDGWPQSWQAHGNLADITVQATDGTKLAAGAHLAGTAWERFVKSEIAAGTVKAWYRLNDPPGETKPADSGPQGLTQDGHVHGTPRFGQEGLLQDETTGCRWESDDAVNIPPEAVPTGVQWQIEFLMRRATHEDVPASATGEWIFSADNGSTNLPPSIWMAFANTGAGQLVVKVRPFGDATGLTVTTPDSLWDDKIHHVLVKRHLNLAETETLVTIQVDGVTVASDTGLSNTIGFGPFTHPEPTTRPFIGNSFVSGNFQGTLQEFVMFDGLPTEDSGYTSSRTPLEGSTTDAAVSAALDDIGWPASLRSIGVGASTLQSHGLGGSALEYIRRITRTEAGSFGFNESGDAVFVSRDDIYVLNTVVKTFEDNPSDSAFIPYDEIVFAHDDTNLVNAARIGREGGPVYTVEDAASVAQNFIHELDETDLLHETNEEVLDRANWVVARKKDFRTEVRSITINLHDDRIADVGSLLFQIGRNSTPGKALVRVIRNPASGAAIDGTYRVEQVVHSGNVRSRTWTVTLQLSLWDEDLDQPWLLGDAEFGVLGTTTRLGF